MNNLREAYQLMQANCGIKVGDTVRVLRTATHEEERAYGATWIKGCKSFIGMEYKVERIDKDCVVIAGVQFPFFVIEKIKDAESEYPIKLGDKFIISGETYTLHRVEYGTGVQLLCDNGKDWFPAIKVEDNHELTIDVLKEFLGDIWDWKEIYKTRNITETEV